MAQQLRLDFSEQELQFDMMLTHRFRSECYDLRGLLDNCQTIDEFCRRLVMQADTGTGPTGQIDPNTYRGDGLEYFTEALIKMNGKHPDIGITDYHTITRDDIGVDGVGFGANGYPATVQVKFRSNNFKRLTANEDHLTNFLGASQNYYGVRLEDRKNMLIVTTAKGLNFFTDEKMLSGKVRCLGIGAIKKIVDNNYGFWDTFRKYSSPYYVKLAKAA
jgi:hypothetical protein